VERGQVHAGFGDRVAVLESDGTGQRCECGNRVADGVDAVDLAQPCGQVGAGGVQSE
jgi:hypothetical protein